MNKQKANMLRTVAEMADRKDPTLYRRLKRLYFRLNQRKRHLLFAMLKDSPPRNQVAANVFRLLLLQNAKTTGSKRVRPLHGAKKAKR